VENTHKAIQNVPNNQVCYLYKENSHEKNNFSVVGFNKINIDKWM
jgi:hypothetical protein